MHLIDEAIAADGGSVHHAAKQKRSAGPVNACHPQDNAVVGEDDLLGLAQNLCVFGIGLGCALFGDETSVILWINAGATGENDSRAWETGSEIGRAIAIDMKIRIGAGTRAVHNHIGGEAIAANRFQISDVHRTKRDRALQCSLGRLLCSRPADDLPPFLRK